MKKIAIWMIYLYSKIISPYTYPCCRFFPTCSDYAIQAFQKRGFFKGGLLVLYRILRCNPWGGSGYDPIQKSSKEINNG